MSVFSVIIILIVLIVVHELGHFLVAKWRGVRVDEFGVGYPPRAFTFGKWGGTEYTLNWLPFGGFVKLFGEDGKKGRGSFAAASHFSQALILIAGVTANVLLAWLLFAGAFMLGMPTVVADDTPGAQLFISAVVPDSPAAQAGVIVGDEVLSVISEDGRGAAPLTPPVVSEFISERGGEVLTVTVARGELHEVFDIAPAHAVIEDAEGRPALGIALTMIAQQQLPLHTALLQSANHTAGALVVVTQGIGGLIKDAFVGSADVRSLVGPVGLVGVVDDAIGHGFGHLLGLAAFISINLAIINLIPIPALDGGRLVLVGVEAATRREVPVTVVSIINLLGFALIILLMIAVTYNDIARIVQ